MQPGCSQGWRSLEVVVSDSDDCSSAVASSASSASSTSSAGSALSTGSALSVGGRPVVLGPAADFPAQWAQLDEASFRTPPRGITRTYSEDDEVDTSDPSSTSPSMDGDGSRMFLDALQVPLPTPTFRPHLFPHRCSALLHAGLAGAPCNACCWHVCSDVSVSVATLVQCLRWKLPLRRIVRVPASRVTRSLVRECGARKVFELYLRMLQANIMTHPDDTLQFLARLSPERSPKLCSKPLRQQSADRGLPSPAALKQVSLALPMQPIVSSYAQAATWWFAESLTSI